MGWISGSRRPSPYRSSRPSSSVLPVAIVKLRTVQRRRFAGEEKWFDLFQEVGPLEFALAFVNAGESPSQMSTVNLWLEGQIAGLRLFSPDTGTDCRRVLDRHEPAKIRALVTRPIPGQFNSGHAA